MEKDKITAADIFESPFLEGAENLSDKDFDALRVKLDAAWRNNSKPLDVGKAKITTFIKPV